MNLDIQTYFPGVNIQKSMTHSLVRGKFCDIVSGKATRLKLDGVLSMHYRNGVLFDPLLLHLLSKSTEIIKKFFKLNNTLGE